MSNFTESSLYSTYFLKKNKAVGWWWHPHAPELPTTLPRQVNFQYIYLQEAAGGHQTKWGEKKSSCGLQLRHKSIDNNLHVNLTDYPNQKVPRIRHGGRVAVKLHKGRRNSWMIIAGIDIVAYSREKSRFKSLTAVQSLGRTIVGWVTAKLLLTSRISRVFGSWSSRADHQ